MPSLCVVVAAGPDKGRRASLGPDSLRVGRGHGQGLQLSDGAVSRHHLTLRVAPGPGGEAQVQVSELRGVNPVWTLVGGQRVNLAVGATLAVGGSLTLGNTTLVVEQDTTGLPTGSSTVEIDARLDDDPQAPNRLAALARPSVNHCSQIFESSIDANWRNGPDGKFEPLFRLFLYFIS